MADNCGIVGVANFSINTAYFMNNSNPHSLIDIMATNDTLLQYTVRSLILTAISDADCTVTFTVYIYFGFTALIWVGGYYMQKYRWADTIVQ